MADPSGDRGTFVCLARDRTQRTEMIVVLSHAADATADFTCARLDKECLEFVRLDTERLAKHARFSLVGGIVQLALEGRSVKPEQVSSVLLRRPRPISIDAADSAEAAHTSSEWTEALEAFLACVPIERWINHPTRAAAASHKIEQLTRASRLGFEVPATLVTQDEGAARLFLSQHKQVIVKPLSGGFIERSSGQDTLIYTTRVLPTHVEHLSLVERCPVLFQAEVDKVYDVRLTAVDGRFSAVALRKQDEEGRQVTDIRRDNWEGVSYQRIEVPERVAALLTTMLRQYGLRFAAVDFGVDADDRWYFFEVNAGGQWAWLDMQAETDIAGDLAWAMSQTP
jgi:Prokaryotic glutathione synthetase, ATP-grasp domain